MLNSPPDPPRLLQGSQAVHIIIALHLGIPYFISPYLILPLEILSPGTQGFISYHKQHASKMIIPPPLPNPLFYSVPGASKSFRITWSFSKKSGICYKNLPKMADERLPSRHTRMLGNAENDEVPGFFRRRWAMHLVGVRGAQPAVTAQVLQAREGGLVGARCHSVTLPLFFN